MTTLLILLFICHWLGDYTHLSTSWMLSAKRFGQPLFPILVHAAVHAALMGIVLLFYVRPVGPIFWALVGFQLLSHFFIGVWKGTMNSIFPSLTNPANKCHWYIFGLDQLLHAVVIIKMAEITLS